MKSTCNIISLFLVLAGAITGVTETRCAIDLSPLVNQIADMRTQLISAVAGLSKGQTEIHQVYQDGRHGLKPQLLDQLSQIIQQTEKSAKDIEGSLAPLKKLPSFVEWIAVRLVNIADLEPTLTWIIDQPLQAIINSLKETHATFSALGEKIRSGSKESVPLDEHFTNAITKLQKAVCRVERTLAALKEDFVVSAPCQK